MIFSERSSGASFQDAHDEVRYHCSSAASFFSSSMAHRPPRPTLFTLTALPTNDSQHPPEQSYSPLWSPLSLTLVVLKKDTAPTIGQNVAHSHCLAYSLFHYLFSFIPLSTQCRTMQRRRTGWRLMTGLVTWWHTKGQVSKIPLRSGTCVTVQPCLQPFLWSRVSLSSLALSPSGNNDKAPICCGDAGLSVSELIPHSSFPFVRYADRVSLLTPRCFTLRDRYEGSSVLRRNVLETW